MSNQLAQLIDAVDFDSVFRVEGDTVVRVDSEYAPSVFHDEAEDVYIDGEGWTCLTGHTGQYGYHGAVMHSSEFIGAGIAEDIAERAREAAEDGTRLVFAVVVVEVFPDDDDPEPEPAGWAIAYKEVGSDG